MQFFIICTIGNIILNIFIAIFHYKTCSNFKDLGKIKVPILIDRVINRRKKKVYILTATIDGKKVVQTISKDDYNALENFDTALIYARKFQSKFNSYVTEYQFSLHEIDWSKKDKTLMWKQFMFFFIIYEVIIVSIAFQLEMNFL